MAAAGWRKLCFSRNSKSIFHFISYPPRTCFVHYKADFYETASEPIFLRARNFQDRTALLDRKGSVSYKRLLQLSAVLGQKIVENCSDRDLVGKRVSFLCPNDVSYVSVQWAIWRNAGIAVPLCSSHPIKMLEYFLEDSDSALLVTTEEFHSKLKPLAHKLDIPLLEISPDDVPPRDEDLGLTAVEMEEENWDDREAIMFYTSGTTGKPKGVLTTHGNIRAQVTGMIKAWGWTENDCILHVLPLHHVHGVTNVLACPLWVGATCVMLEKFDPQEVWQYLTGSDHQLSLFMAVPTIYSKLIAHFNNSNHSQEVKNQIKEKCSKIRLMVSGSSALPEPTMDNWYDVTGHTLLERYGMTEIGMALSNPLHGHRIAGSVGTPLPGVQVRIVAKDQEDQEINDQILIESDENGPSMQQPGVEPLTGALQVRGPSVFKSYWRRPEATDDSFTANGWFKTGDDAEYRDGVYKILGRSSVDIIKSKGYKISALDVERELLAHPCIRDCAVLGVPDAVQGQRVAVIVSLHSNKNLTLEDLRKWSADRLSPYQTPSVLEITDELPRNVMGKVNKREVYETFFAGQQS